MFVPLSLHSNYSLLSGATAVDDLVRAAQAFGYESVALTDVDNLYGAIVFFKYCREKKIRPITGTELTTDAGTLTLLAADAHGYANICRLITERMINDRPVPLASVIAREQGIVCIAHEPDTARTLRDVFGVRGYLGIVGDTDSRSYYVMMERMKFVAQHHLQAVALAPVYFLSPFDYPTHQVLTAIRLNNSVAKLHEGDAQPPGYYFRSPDEIASIFAPFPELIATTEVVAAQCQFAFALGTYTMPHVPIDGSGTAFEKLWDRAFRGVRERYPVITHAVMDRLEHELQVIDALGFSEYFLVAHDIVNFCHRQGIPCVGRGSAASSIVSYALGITDICPIEFNLYFERFLNAARRDPPDIDLDICGRRRDEVLAWVYERYGTERVAAVCSIITMQSRAVVREVSKAMGLTDDEISTVAKRLPHGSLHWSLTLLGRRPERNDIELDTEPFKSILAFSRKLDGFPRHLGMHPCGIVIAPDDLASRVPLEWATKGLIVTQYDMYSIDDLGLIKMDLLGQRALTILSDVLMHLKKRGIAIDLHAIPPRDPDAMRLVAEGRTLGVFQIESPGMRTLLKQMPIRTINDICLALSVIRPGAADSGAKEKFVQIVNGKAEPEYLCEELRPILEETFGCVIYQEQVMRIVGAIAGLSLTDADRIRRAMTKGRSTQEMESMQQTFLQGARRIVDADTAQRIWELVARFSGYGYCKAHAMTYAHISYREAYLKARYPAEYMAAVCSSEAGYYHVSVYVEEAKRLGVRVLLPDINHSEYYYTVEQDAMRIGFMQVKNLERATVDRIIEARTCEGFFTSLGDLLTRVAIDETEVEMLIKCGALDCFENTRPELLWKLKLQYAEHRKSGTENLLIAAEPAWAIIPHVADFGLVKKYEMEFALLDVSARCHPTELLRAAPGIVPSTEFAQHTGKTIKSMGWIVAYRRTATKDRKEMLFLTCEDRVGIYEVILWPELCARDGDIMYKSRMIEITGKVEKQGQIVAEKVRAVLN